MQKATHDEAWKSETKNTLIIWLLPSFGLHQHDLMMKMIGCIKRIDYSPTSTHAGNSMHIETMDKILMKQLNLYQDET